MSEEHKGYSTNDLTEIFKVSSSAIRKYIDDYNLHIQKDELGNLKYTEEDIKIFDKIITMKKNGANLYIIRRALSQNTDILEYREKSIETTRVSELNSAELIELMGKALLTSVQGLQQQHKEEIEAIHESYKKEVENIREEVIQAMQHQSEQRSQENMKLMTYLEKRREERSFWERIFNK